jgi:hypothetical protein
MSRKINGIHILNFAIYRFLYFILWLLLYLLGPTTLCVTFMNIKVYYSYILTSTVWNPQALSKTHLNVKQCNACLIWKHQSKTEEVKMPDRVDCSSILWYPNHSNSMMATTWTLLSSQYILQRQTSLALTRSQDTWWSFFGFTQPRKGLFRHVRQTYCLCVQGNWTEFRWVQK